MHSSVRTSRRMATTALVVLVGLSVATWILMQSAVYATGTAVATALLAVGFFKAWLVGFEFMGIRNAPRPLQGAFYGWLVVTFVTLMSITLS